MRKGPQCGPFWSAVSVELGDADVVDPGRRRARGDVEREQAEGVLRGRGLDRPPDRVAARVARPERRLTAKRAVVPLEGGERDPALGRVVTVVEEVSGHGSTVPPPARGDIRVAP